MNYLNSTVVAVITAVASSVAFAQKDPQTDVTLANVVVDGQSLDAVTLSRDGLVTRFAQDLTFTNNTTNALNRLYFTATVTNTGGTGADNGTLETIYFTEASGTFDCTGFGSSKLSCTSNISLNPDTGNTTQKVTLVGLAPASGTKLTVTVSAGGYEGNSQTGKGCCAKILSETTDLIDSTTDRTRSYTLNAITFVSRNTGGQLFTGAKSVALGRRILLRRTLKRPRSLALNTVLVRSKRPQSPRVQIRTAREEIASSPVTRPRFRFRRSFITRIRRLRRLPILQPCA